MIEAARKKNNNSKTKEEESRNNDSKSTNKTNKGKTPGRNNPWKKTEEAPKTAPANTPIVNEKTDDGYGKISEADDRITTYFQFEKKTPITLPQSAKPWENSSTSLKMQRKCNSK